MITEKAPPLFLFYLDETISDDSRKTLLELEGKAELSPEDNAKIAEITAEYKNLRKTTPIPVPIVGDLIGMIPDGYSQTMTKGVDIVKGVPVLKNNLNALTVTLKTSGNDFVNALLGVAGYLFDKEDSLPRISFFSPQAVIIGGTLLNMSRYSNSDTSEQVLSFEIQKGNGSHFKKTTEAKEKECEVIEDTSNILG
ncbi:TPA: hypothetical protein ACVU43_003013 [Vibrio parahaemolyticus]